MTIYLARQPVFNRQQKVIAYELLYRASKDNYYPGTDGDQATSDILSYTFLNIGLEKITRGKKAYINFTKQLLDQDVALLFPKELVAVEIVEDVEPDQKTIEACQKLHEQGYELLLDDFNLDSKAMPLLDIVDIIKVDFRDTNPAERKKILQFFKGSNKIMLAEKVESAGEYLEAMSSGFDYFQGYFFCEPVVMTGKDFPSTKLQNIRLLQEIYKPQMDFDQVEQLIKIDSSLSYKLLRFINSVAFPVRFSIRSIRQAMALLGQKEMIKWASLVALRNVAYDKPDELLVTAVSRAKFCELVAKETSLRDHSADLFLTGLFSLLDTFLDRPMDDILSELPLNTAIKKALLGEKNDFYSILELVQLYERGMWDEAFKIAGEDYGIGEVKIMSYYLDALELADLAWK